MDLSGSMYYFNNHDRRLERALQTAVMIFEAFSGFEHKYHYAMVGHSGDTPCAPLVAYGAPPENEKQRLQVQPKCMCMSMPHTCMRVFMPHERMCMPMPYECLSMHAHDACARCMHP